MTHDYHTPVLSEKVLEFLLTTTAGIYIDATLGGGGHAEQILQRLSSDGLLIGLDADEDAVRFSNERLRKFDVQMKLIRDNFVNVPLLIRQNGIPRIDGILFDLGVSSYQLDEEGKGFSYRGNERLDMRMDRRQSFDAAQLLNTLDEAAISDILRTHGEERYARKIARRIVERRQRQNFERCSDLATVVEGVLGKNFLNKSLSRVFQALRIAVNNELDNLRQGLRGALDVLRPGGRMVVIAYHSLEDRIVKDFFRTESATTIPSGHKLVPDTIRSPMLKLLTKKPVLALETEIKLNPRSRSAKLRAAERIS